MIRKEVLIRSDNKVASYIKKHVTRAGTEKRGEVLELFHTMHQFFPQWVIATCPVMHPDIHYISKNARDVFGYSNEYFLDNIRLEKYLSHVHEADQKDFFDCINFMYDHLESVSPDIHHEYRIILHYRFRKANGQYIYLYDEKASVHLKGSGNLYYSLLRDLSGENVFKGVKAELYTQKNGLSKIWEYKRVAERNPLSKREQELVTLIKRGLSTKEIAWQLNISHNTVRNIKSKLFEKYNVSNSIELLNMTA